MIAMSVFAPQGIGLIEPAQALWPEFKKVIDTEGFSLKDGDVLVVAQKVVSKSESRLLNLSSVIPSTEAEDYADKCQKDPRLVQLVLDESERVLRCVPGVLIVRHRLGFTLANAGIDQSNLSDDAEDTVLLLPKNPDESAQQLRQAIFDDLAVDVAVLISDSFGRPWRIGTTAVCIGCAGISPLHDQRGGKDLAGRELKVTQPAIADQLAATAAVLMGEAAEGLPLAIIRNAPVIKNNDPLSSSAGMIVRSLEEDLFQ